MHVDYRQVFKNLGYWTPPRKQSNVTSIRFNRKETILGVDEPGKCSDKNLGRVLNGYINE